MQNPQYDVTDRINEATEMYRCVRCGESVAADDCYSTSDEMDALCEDCHFYGRERNEAAIREPWEN